MPRYARLLVVASFTTTLMLAFSPFVLGGSQESPKLERLRHASGEEGQKAPDPYIDVGGCPGEGCEFGPARSPERYRCL